MDSGSVPAAAPSPTQIDATFRVYGVRRDGDRLLYFGTPAVDPDNVEPSLYPDFRAAGYEIELQEQAGATEDVSHVLIASPVDLSMNGIPWTNVILFLATVLSTLYVGSVWYHIDLSSDPWRVVHAWPFAAGVMAVLGIHELGHYVMSRYYGVRASLPYFIPVPTIFGTMGAVIKISGRIPSRKALFDIGVAGPLAGIVAAIVVTIIGLHLPPVTAPSTVVDDPEAIYLSLGYPPLLEFLAWMFDQPLRFADPAVSPNPLIIAGWLGMFITFLNLIPVGQLDGGHITRAMIGPNQRLLGRVIPVALFGLGFVLYLVFSVPLHAVAVWLIWGVFGAVLAAVGPANPIIDTQLDRRRMAIGVVTFVIGVLCFVPVPIELVDL